jgi:hypothetical protein
VSESPGSALIRTLRAGLPARTEFDEREDRERCGESGGGRGPAGPPPGARDDQAVRLAELGVLSATEPALLHTRAVAAMVRIENGRERLSDGVSLDQQAVELSEQVWEAAA